MLFSPDRQERRELLRQFFRLIDSFERDNIDLAMTVMQGNRPLRQAFEQRYYPLLRAFSPHLGEGARRLLLRIADERYSPMPHTQRKCVETLLKFYQAKGEAETAWGIVKNARLDDILSNVGSPVVLRLALLDERADFAQCVKSITLSNEKDALPPQGEAEHWAERLKNVESLIFGKCPAWWDFFAPLLPLLPKLRSISLEYMCSLPASMEHIQKPYRLRMDYGSELQKMPDFLFTAQSHLAELTLDSCGVVELPPALYTAPKLKSLTLCNLPMKRLPEPAAGVDSPIEEVHLTNLALTDFPVEVLALLHLRSLHLTKVPIQSLPVFQAPVFAKLRFLYLSNNGLRDITDWYCGLPSLQEFTFYNDVERVSDCFFRLPLRRVSLIRLRVSALLRMELPTRLAREVNLAFL